MKTASNSSSSIKICLILTLLNIKKKKRDINKVFALCGFCVLALTSPKALFFPGNNLRSCQSYVVHLQARYTSTEHAVVPRPSTHNGRIISRQAKREFAHISLRARNSIHPKSCKPSEVIISTTDVIPLKGFQTSTGYRLYFPARSLSRYHPEE